MSVPSSVLQLRFSVKNLKSKDLTSQSDPFVVAYIEKGGSFIELGRTERIKDANTCSFETVVKVTYFFEAVQNMKFKVYDSDEKDSSDLSQHDFIGEACVRLSEIVGLHRGQFTDDLQKPGKKKSSHRGKLTVTAEEDRNARGDVSFRFSGEKLDKKDLFGKSDPYFELYRTSPSGSWELVHKTEVIPNTLNPVWVPFSLSLASVCNGDLSRSLQIKVYDWDKASAPDLIGIMETTLQELMDKSKEGTAKFPLINPKKQAKKKHYKDSGKLICNFCDIIVMPTFVDYLSAGFELDFTVAIDFTASNGTPTLPSSLHYMHPSALNEYQQALQAVGNVISDYDKDKWFPGFGFGLKKDGQVSFLHPLNGSMDRPYCAGVQGLMDAYRQCLPSIQLWGPTNMSPMVNHIAGRARHNERNKYSVLLIITDGEITDMDATKKAIVEASSTPLSIIIVGVGGADFAAMKELDGDDGALTYHGQRASRDIVQFVPFREVAFAPDGMASLAREVLAEVPSQFLQYMKENDIKP